MTLAKGGGAVSPSKIQDATKANKVALNSGSNKIEFTTNSVLNATLDSAGTLSLGTSSGAVGIEVVRSSASTDFGLKLKNSANGDIKLTLETAAQSYSFGVDNSDNDYLKLSTSSIDVGSSTLWTIKPDGKLGLLTVPTSTLHVAGSIAQTITILTSATTLDGTHSLVHVNATSDTVNISLPTSVGIAGRSYIVMKTDASANTVVIDGNASETISGDLTLTLTGQYDWVTLRSDGANWITEGSNNLENSSICLDSGTLSVLPLNFCTDTNTGLYNPGADSLSLVTGGTSRIDITNSTTTVTNNLNVTGNSNLNTGSTYKINSVDVLSSTALGSSVVSSSLTSVGTLSSLVVSGTEHVGGDVFVGATSGTALGKLHVKQSASGVSSTSNQGDALILEDSTHTGISILTPNTQAGNIVFQDPEGYAGQIQYDHSVDKMHFYTTGAIRTTIDSSGNVGIGTSPFSGAKLTVSDGSSAAWKMITSGTVHLEARNSSDTGYTSAFYDATQHIFRESGVETFRVWAGNLSLGAENFALAKLHVKIGTSSISAVNVDGALIESAANGALTVATPNTAGGYIMFADPQSNIAGVVKYNHANDNMSFFTNSVERVIINSTGLGIGATPTSKLDVNGRLTLSGTGTSELYTTDASGLYLTAATNSGMYIASDGAMFFRKATTPFTEYMRLDSSGNLGINQSSPVVRLTSRSGTNAFPASSGTTQTGGALRLEGGDNAVIDFGCNSINTWIQATDKGNLANIYNLLLNPNGGNVGVGISSSLLGKLHVKQSASGVSSTSNQGDALILEDSTHTGISILTPNTQAGNIVFQDPEGYAGQIQYDHSVDKMHFYTTGAIRTTIDSSGNVGIGTATSTTLLTVNGPIALKAPSTVNASTYTVSSTDSSLRFTTTNCTVTLPTASSFTGRIIYMNTITANSVDSASSNVIPLGSNTAGTAILAATAGKFTMLQSDGSNWITMMSN